jgi:hypothetical protein
VNTKVTKDKPARLSARISVRPGNFERHGDKTLDLFGRTARHLGGHLDLHVGHIGKRIDRQAHGGATAKTQQNNRHHQHQQALGQGGTDQ